MQWAAVTKCLSVTTLAPQNTSPDIVRLACHGTDPDMAAVPPIILKRGLWAVGIGANNDGLNALESDADDEDICTLDSDVTPHLHFGSSFSFSVGVMTWSTAYHPILHLN